MSPKILEIRADRGFEHFLGGFPGTRVTSGGKSTVQDILSRRLRQTLCQLSDTENRLKFSDGIANLLTPMDGISGFVAQIG